jgi:nucleotidyltransferase/DNA polymerase involved in DNA repair
MRVACIWLPHFPVAIERRNSPALNRRPVIIGKTTEQRGAVLDCSAEAESQGVRVQMPLRQALGLCPSASFLPPDLPRYGDSFDRILRALEAMSPLVDPASLGCAFIGLGGLNSHYRDEMALGDALAQAVRRVSGLMPSVGLAEGKFTAQVAATVSAPGEVCLVPKGQERRFLAPIDVSLLPCSRDTLRHLELFGLRTMGDLASLPMGAVQAQFGAEGRRIWELVRGIDREPLRPLRREESIREHLAFYAPLMSREALVTAGRELLTRLLGQSAMRGRAARRMTLRALLSDGRSWERAIVFREATADQEHMLCVLKSAIEAAPLTAPIEELSIELSGFAGETGKQDGFFSGDRRRQPQVAEAVRQLKARYGRSPVAQVVEVEPWSRIPERRHALIDYDP